MDNIETSTRTAHVPNRLGWLIATVVAVAAALPFLRTLAYPFVYDDGAIIAANPALHSRAAPAT